MSQHPPRKKSPRSPQVALFGFYQYGNFGDDLMMAIIGRTLRACGVRVRVYCADRTLLREVGFPGAASISGLLRGAHLVVYGGGGAFLSGNQFGDFHADLVELHTQCVRRRLPLVMISVGGDGAALRRLHPARRKLLEIASRGTFRNREDRPLLACLDGHSAIHDDIAWQTPNFFPLGRPPCRPGRLTIGIDGSMLDHAPGRQFIRTLLRAASARRIPCRWLVYNQNRHLRWPEEVAGLVSYRSIRDFVRAIAQADLVLTHRLHLGIVAMSGDIPVLQIAPCKKARILFARLRLKKLVVKSPADIKRVASAVLDRKWLRDHRPSRMIADYSAVKADSGKHLDALRRWVHEFTPARLSTEVDEGRRTASPGAKAVNTNAR